MCLLKFVCLCLQRNLRGEAESGQRLSTQTWNQKRCGGCTGSFGEWEKEGKTDRQTERGLRPERKGSRRMARWTSLHYHVTIYLISYLQPLAREQCSSHRPLHCVLQWNLRGLTREREREKRGWIIRETEIWKLRETALMRHNWMEGSFNLIKTKSVLVSQCVRETQITGR